MDDLISTVSQVRGTSNIPMLFKLMNECPVVDVSGSSRFIELRCNYQRRLLMFQDDVWEDDSRRCA